MSEKIEKPEEKLLKLPKKFEQQEKTTKKVLYMATQSKPTLTKQLDQLQDIVSSEINRLMAKIASGEHLSLDDAKRLQMLMEGVSKLNRETREQKKQSVLEGKSDAEIADLVTEAMEVLKVKQ